MLLVSMSVNLFGNVFKKYINDKYQNNMFSYQFYNAVVSFSALIVLLIMSDEISFSLFTVLLSLVFGAVTLIQQISNLYALETGSFAYTSVIISLSTLIPTLSGKYFWNESISLVQYLGIALLVVCFFFSVNFKENTAKGGVKWLMFCLTAFICTGSIGVLQKIHQQSVFSNELNGFLILSFLFSFISSTVISLVTFFRNKEKFDRDSKNTILQFLPFLLMVISGVFVAVNNKFNLYLSGVMDSAIFFPTVNGGGLVLSTIASFLLFKEKLTQKQWLGILIGIIAVVLICTPI